MIIITDRQEIKDSKRKITDEGFLVVPAIISRTGIQEYYAFELGLEDRAPTDIIRVWRPEEEVFNDESLNSFKNKVVTNNHPPEMINISNVKDYAVGFSASDVLRKGIFATTDLTITDIEAIKDIDAGKVEISNGYVSDLEIKSGVNPDGEKYDAIQRNIRGNHIALVEKGRCGPACKISDSLNQPNQKETSKMVITIDGVDFEVTEQVAQAVTKLHKRCEDAEKKADMSEEEMLAMKKEKEDAEEEAKKTEDSYRAKLDDAKAKAPTPEMLDKLVENRLATRDKALKVNPNYDWKGKDCETVRKEIVKDACSDVDVEKESAEYIRARFDSLTATNANNLDEAFSKRVKNKDGENTVVSIADEARQKMIERNRNAYKGGTK